MIGRYVTLNSEKMKNRLENEKFLARTMEKFGPEVVSQMLKEAEGK